MTSRRRDNDSDSAQGSATPADMQDGPPDGAPPEQMPDDSYLTTDGRATESSGATVSEQEDTGTAVDEHRDRYLRLAAEYENFRKRSTRERMEAGTRAQADLVRQIVDALDDLARFAHVDPATVDAATVVQGADMVERKLLKTLGAAGLEVVSPVGEPFDPAVHEALGTEPAENADEDHVVSKVYQSGYTFKGQLLRPARVVVKQWNG